MSLPNSNNRYKKLADSLIFERHSFHNSPLSVGWDQYISGITMCLNFQQYFAIIRRDPAIPLFLIIAVVSMTVIFGISGYYLDSKFNPEHSWSDYPSSLILPLFHFLFSHYYIRTFPDVSLSTKETRLSEHMPFSLDFCYNHGI